jgi:transposase-like protein
MDFPIFDLMDEDACYAKLVECLHPDGFACPRCGRDDRMAVHLRTRPPILDYRCGHCKRVFNAFTGTALHGVKRRPTELVLIVRGFAQGVSTAQLARELECDRSELLNLRHRLQDLAFRNRDRMPLDDEVLEADEAYQNAGEKRGPAHRPRRSAAAAGEPGARPRHLGERPSADLRGGRSREWGGAADGDRAVRWRDVGAGREAGELADGDGQHGRMGRLQRAAGDGAPAVDGVPRGGGVGAGRRR